METVQEDITKENKKKDVLKVLDSINAVEKATTLDHWIGYPAYSENQWPNENSVSLLGESVKQILVGLTYVR